MNQSCKTALAGFLNFTLLTNQILADLPPITFDTAEWVPMQTVGNGTTPGWQLFAGDAKISPVGQGLGGGSALSLPVNTVQETKISRAVTWDVNEKTAFIDLQVKPAADPSGSYATFVANGTQIAFQVPDGSTTGEIWVQHGADGIVDPGAVPKQWIKTAGTFNVAANGTASDSYIRVTLRQDYLRNLWDLFIDGKLAAANLAFDGRGTNLESLEFYGSGIGETLIDDLSAVPVNMLFPDADKDGLSDAWEDANGSDKNLYDRDAMKPGTSGSFLDAYMASLWSNKGVNGSGAIPASGGIPPLTISSEAPHQAVGSLKGSLSVGGDGSANYSIPIDIPKGTGGMEPKLSLGYSSGSGNGIMGVGWNLGGLQRITRGPSTAAKDGTYDPVGFDGNDRFFLDGERLVCVAGSYGAAGSEYRTEIDSFARITAVGAGPASWKVETKAGLTMTLGGTVGSKVSTSRGTLSWGVTRVQDTLGNFYSVDYEKDAANSSFDAINQRVAKVQYTGQVDAAGNVTRAPYCTIDFLYDEGRPDNSRSFSTYAGYRLSKRLSKVRVMTGAYINHSYRLAYVNSYQSGRSLLKSVTKHARDLDSLAVPPTTFTYDGIQAPPAGSTDSPIWENPGSTNLPRFGSGLDASGEVNSTVTVDEAKTTIRLTGDVSRAYRLSTPVYSDTKIQFEFNSYHLETGAMIGLDTDTVYQGSSSTLLYRIGGTGTINLANGLNFTGPTQPYSPENTWKTYTLNIGSLGTVANGYLILMCVDNDSSDGEDSASFRNVRIYRSGSQQASDVPPVEFGVDWELPRLTDDAGKDKGVVSLDLNSDGLPDFADWHAIDYSLSNGTLSPVTQGAVYINTGSMDGGGFTQGSTYRPPGILPLATRSWDAKAHSYNTKNHLTAQPMDVDGDGRLDLLGSVDLKFTSGSFFKSYYKFYTFKNGAWNPKGDEWDLPFYMGSTTSGSPSVRRDEHFQWVDLNGDGYQDLVVYTTGTGKLFNPDTNGLVANTNVSVAFINKGKNGPGWIRDNSLYLPAKLLSDGKDTGRRLIDLDGDGLPELASAAFVNGSGTVWSNHNLLKTGAYRWNPATEEGRPADPYKFPAALLYSNDNPTAAQLMDVNGDGLVDMLYSINNSGTLVSNTWLNRGWRESNPWQPENAPSADSYRLPYPLYNKIGDAETTQATPYGFECGDINGDGLVDILYSDVDNSATAGTDDLVFRNTGNGWQSEPTWGIPGTVGIYNDADERNAGKRRAKLMDVTGDGFPDLVTGLIYSSPKVWKNKCVPEVLRSVVDGMGTELQVDYNRLNDPTPIPGFGTRVYEPFTGTLPAGQSAIIDSRLVVSRYSEPDGRGGVRYRSQRYGDLRYDRFNESSLGFRWIEARDGLNDQVARTEFCQVYPFGGSPLSTTSKVRVRPWDLLPALVDVTATEEGKTMSEETATYAEMPSQSGIGGIIRRPVQTSSVKILRDLVGNIVSKTTTVQNLADFDAYGFVKKSTVTSLDTSTVTTVSSFDQPAVNASGKVALTTPWHLGRLRRADVLKKAPGKTDITKTSTFDYDTATGLLWTETIEPGDALFKSTKTYTRDNFGNITRTGVTCTGLPERYSNAGYDSQGRFMRTETNQLGHTVTYDYDDSSALLDSTTDIGGKTTSFIYDAYGTLTLTDSPDGTKTGESTGYYTGSLPSWVTAAVENPIKFYRAKQSSGTPVGKVYLDTFGREVVAETTILKSAGAGGGASLYRKVYVVSTYDSHGRKTKVSEPFGAGDSPRFTVINYDILSRVVKTTHPDGQFDEVLEYSTKNIDSQPAPYSSVQNRNGGILKRWEDQHGRLIQSQDASNLTTRFTHDVEGRLINVAIGGQTLLTNKFDQLGNKTEVWEKNSGLSLSTYNPLGEVTTSKNAKGQVTTYTPDSAGRPYSVTKAEGTYITEYSTASGFSLGKPFRTTGPNGYQETISYDQLGRPRSTSKTQFGETFTTSNTYDALGRVLTETDAGGFTVVHEYDSQYSFPVRLSIGFGSVGYGTTLWQAGTYDSKGRMLTQTLANDVTTTAAYDDEVGLPNRETGALRLLNASRGGTTLQAKTYDWDTLGNLTSRTDGISGRTEGFLYDGLNRVKQATVSGTGGPPVADFTYDDNGNLRTKPGASLTYADAQGRPHAVSSATIKGESRTYTYDAAGYVTSDSKRDYTWTSFGQLSSLDYLSAPILQNLAGIQIYAASRVQTNFEFDAGGNRAYQKKQRIAADDTRILEETLYLGSYERETHSTRTSGNSPPVTTRVVHRHSIGGFAVYTQTDKPGLPAETKLTTILKDHLGSTDALYTTTWNGSTFASPTTENQSFDAWGERRDPATLVAFRATGTDAFRTSGQDYDRGYTGHEQLDDSGLIHMNGRIYDPELGRMLGPDPVVQVAEYSQNFNRYSYVMNNPLNLTDPTGFSWVGKAFHAVGGWLRENWKTVVVIVVVAVITICSFGTLTGAAAAAGGALLGATAAAAVTASIGAWAVAAIGGAFLGGIAGGLSAALAGGDLGDVLRGAVIGGVSGALTAGLTASGVGGYGGQVAGQGIIGGATNEAMGGKFQDGFLSAAAGAAAGMIPYANTGVAGLIKSSVVGGTASALGGGKFANGASMAAFQYLVTTGIESPRVVKRYVGWNVNFDTNSPNFGKPDPALGWENEGLSDPSFAIGVTYVEGMGVGAAFKGAGLAIGAGIRGAFATESGLFWGGGVTAAQAEIKAIELGAQTLGQTMGGKAVGALVKTLEKVGFSKTFTYNTLWKPASRIFANETRSFGGLFGKGGEIWRTIEKPILQERGLLP